MAVAAHAATLPVPCRMSIEAQLLAAAKCLISWLPKLSMCPLNLIAKNRYFST